VQLAITKADFAMDTKEQLVPVFYFTIGPLVALWALFGICGLPQLGLHMRGKTSDGGNPSAIDSRCQ
jgi:hypothetical protein